MTLALRQTLLPTVLSIGLCVSCGVLSWRDVYVSRQLSGRGTIKLQEMCGFSDCSIRVLVSNGSRSRQILYRRGCAVKFADAIWVGSRVGLFVQGGSCQRVELGFDINDAREIEFSELANSLRGALMKEYGISKRELEAAGGDVFDWEDWDNQIAYRLTKAFKAR